MIPPLGSWSLYQEIAQKAPSIRRYGRVNQVIGLVIEGLGPAASTFPAVSGYPHITVPAGDAFGLPIGLSFFGRAFTEGRLIGLAYAFEQAANRRPVPRFRTTAALPS